MAMLNWNTEHIPDQKGRVIIITGATSGLGKEATRVLAGKNATVIMAIRNIKKEKIIIEETLQEYPQHYSKICKAKTAMNPAEYRSVN